MKSWFLNLPLSKKLILILIFVGLIPMIIASIIAIQTSKSEINKQVFDQLTAVREIKARAVERYFANVKQQIAVMAKSNDIVNASAAFNRSFFRLPRSERFTKEDLEAQREAVRDYYQNQFGATYQEANNGRQVDIEPMLEGLSDETITAQYLYIANNEHPLGEKDTLDKAEGRAVYHNSHELYHPGIRNYLKVFGYYDIFIVDVKSGNIVYSVFKELDYGTSLYDGPYANTNFAEAFREAAEMDKGEIALKDFKQYLPSYEAPASFIATPIFQDDRRIGVLVFQIPLEPINTIMGQRSGMGDTGESYLVGADYLMRSDSYLAPETHSVVASFKNPDEGSVKTEASERAINGEEGIDIITDYNGHSVLSSYAPINIEGLSWSILAEKDTSEAFAGISAISWTIFTFAIIGTLAIGALALLIARLISTPIIQLSELIQRVEKEGNFSLTLNNEHHDEVGKTTRALNGLLKNINLAISGTNQVLTNLSQGNFNSSVEEYFPGQLKDLTTGTNRANEQVKTAKQEQEKQAELAAAKAQEAEESAKKAQQQADETRIIKQALDVSATAVMIADADFEITYQNHSTDKLMRHREAELRETIPGFGADSLLGQHIDVFHKDPNHQKTLLKSLTSSHTTKIEISGLTFNVSATPIRGGNNEYLGTVIEWQDLTDSLAREAQEKQVADENARIRQALDSSSTCTMIADLNNDIIYANNSLSNLMLEAQQDIRQLAPAFDHNQLIGANISVFEGNTNQQDSIPAGQTDTQTREVTMGGRTISITTTPIFNEDKMRLGTVIEWTDRTAEVLIEQEIDKIIEGASQGDFKQTLELNGKQGFFLSISEGLNNLMATTNEALQDILRIFSALASGDLSQSIEREYGGEFAQLKEDANQTIYKLREVISEISDSSTSIARAASEISQGNASLSDRTESQASSLEETASSMEEMTSTLKQTEVNVESAAKLASSSVEIAKQGNISVSKTSHAMQGIRDASEKISNIISVIDEIAFQTNLLALNAAVEAARAGEQGRGFAVVAGEVRNLAQRSATAAKEIKGLIQDSVARVNEGSNLVTDSEETLKNIVQEIEEVGGMMNGLLESAVEQSAGIGQVNTAVIQMDRMTQENAALVEEASAASESMSDQAHQLDQLVSFFKQ